VDGHHKANLTTQGTEVDEDELRHASPDSRFKLDGGYGSTGPDLHDGSYQLCEEGSHLATLLTNAGHLATLAGGTQQVTQCATTQVTPVETLAGHEQQHANDVSYIIRPAVADDKRTFEGANAQPSVEHPQKIIVRAY